MLAVNMSTNAPAPSHHQNREKCNEQSFKMLKANKKTLTEQTLLTESAFMSSPIQVCAQMESSFLNVNVELFRIWQ